MQITLWWDNGDVEEWDSTYLSYHDGCILQGGRLMLANIEEDGVVFRPRYANRHAHRKNLIEQDIVLVPPEDLPSLLRLERNGMTVLEVNASGELVNVPLAAETAGRELAQVEQPDLTALYQFDPETGEILDDGQVYSADVISSLIDEAFDSLTQEDAPPFSQKVSEFADPSVFMEEHEGQE